MNISSEVRRQTTGTSDAAAEAAGALTFSSPDLSALESYQGTPAKSALFTVTTAEVDRDFDRVNPLGIRTEAWAASGAVWFFSHQQYPWPVGTSIDEDGRLQWFPEKDKVKARIFFDLSDPVARFLSKKVSKRLVMGASIAFIPIRADRRDGSAKARLHGEAAGVPGYDYHECSLTEVSVTPIPSNESALLIDAEPEVRKALLKCIGPHCHGWSRDKHVSPRVQQAFKELQQESRGMLLAGQKFLRRQAREEAKQLLDADLARGGALVGAVRAQDGRRRLLRTCVRNLHRMRLNIAQALPELEKNHSRNVVEDYLKFSLDMRNHCEAFVRQLDELEDARVAQKDFRDEINSRYRNARAGAGGTSPEDEILERYENAKMETTGEDDDATGEANLVDRGDVPEDDEEFQAIADNYREPSKRRKRKTQR